MSEHFFDFCEGLWRSWLQGSLSVSPELHRRFDLNAAPEPYLRVATGNEPLVAFTTNPGRALALQRKQAILSGTGPVTAMMDYSAAAVAFARHYQESLRGQPAGRRIETLVTLSSLTSSVGVLQVEACPFHSRSLPDKDGLLADVAGDELLTEYIAHLRAFLAGRSVVIVAAVSTRNSLAPQPRLSRWLTWQADLAGLNPEAAEFVPLVLRRGKTTCAALFSKQGTITKALVLMMGSNQLPGVDGLRLLARVFLK